MVDNPIGRLLLKAAARAPVWAKTPGFAVVVSRLARLPERRVDLVETNAGISGAVRLLLPADKHGLLYGRGRDHLGERATLDLVSLLAGRSSSFIDVGANDGIFAFTVADRLGRSRARDVHVFEPDADVFARLKRNLDRNGLAIVANQAAAGRTAGRARFYKNLSSDESGSLGAHFSNSHDTEVDEVDVVTLAEYLRERGIRDAVVKIDAEGCGTDVWEGLAAEVDRVAFLIVEMIGPEWAANLPARIIAETGWHAYYIRDYDLNEWTAGPYGCLDPCYNWLFCRLGPADLRAMVADNPRFSVGKVG